MDDSVGFNFITEEHADHLKNANVQRGDVIFTHAGNIGQVAYIPPTSQYDRYVISQRQFYMRCDRSKVLPEFVVAYFKTLEGQHQLLANTSQTGVPSIAQPVTYLRRIEIPLPTLTEQQAIACILGVLDDKIEVHRRMNRTLEEMARAIFKSWFVDFDPVRAKAAIRREHPNWSNEEISRVACPNLKPEIAALFPDSFEDSELGEIPKEWKTGAVQDLGEIICGKTPPTTDRNNYGSDVPFVTIPDMHGKVFITNTEKKLSEKGARTQKGKFLPPFSIGVSCIATPGLVALTSTQCQTNQQINSVIPSDSGTSIFSFFSLRGLGERIRTHGAGGSVLLNLNKSLFSSMRLFCRQGRHTPSKMLRSPYLRRC
jgi:type I restriction enzyme, S subunit